MAMHRVSSRGGHWLSEERRVDRFMWMRDVEQLRKLQKVFGWTVMLLSGDGWHSRDKQVREGRQR